MCGGYLQRKRAVASRSRMGVAIVLVLLAQCSPERQVLFSDVPPGTTAYGIGGVGGGPAVGIATGGSNIGAGPSVGGTGGNPCPEPDPPPTTCAHGFEVVMHVHGGCGVWECAPVNECTPDRDCPSGSVCFAGLQCDDGCASPECCSGNHCASASCPAPANVTCLAVGCPAGDVCMAACDSARCTCDGASWNCTYDAGATTNCAFACTLP